MENLEKALELRKAKYTKRTGSPGHYRYTYYRKKGSKREIDKKVSLRTGARDIQTLDASISYKNSEVYSPHQKTILTEYKDLSYLDTNDFLREHISKEEITGSEYDVLNTIKTMDSAFKSSRVLGADVELIRGGDFETSFSVGDKLHDGGYLSTATEIEAAANFASNATDPTMFRIVVPKGTPYIVMGSEHEILLPRGNKLRITKVTRESFKGSGGEIFKAQTVYAILEEGK